jgi:uncharacterized protein YndB with AHSA1/START domain
MSDTDRIVKSVVLNASRERVWRAISESSQFGSWFGMSFDGPFVAGRPITGRIAPTQVDPEVAKLQEPHVGKAFEFMVESIEPMDRLALRWHPYAVDPEVDYSREPMTLVEFVLEDAGAGTKLTITESGFDRIPLARRAEAFKANEGGWEHQTRLIRKYLER